MRIENKTLSFISKSVTALSSIVGVALISGWFDGTFSSIIFSYYTIQSNLLVFFAFTVFAVSIMCVPAPEKYRCVLRFKGAVTLAITVTFLVYHFLLSGGGFAMSASASVSFLAGNSLVHYITPILVLGDWLLFDKKTAFRSYDPVLWLGLPVAYLVFALIRAQVGEPFPGTGSRYPYFFIDVDRYGIRIALYVLILALTFLLLGYAIYAVDRLMGRTTKKGK